MAKKVSDPALLQKLNGSAVVSLPGEWKGLKTPGNLNLDARKVYSAPDGGYRTENSISIGTDDGEVLIPTVIDGKQVTDDEAVQHYQQTGENLGTFDSPDAAETYAQALHLRQADKYKPMPSAGSGAAKKVTDPALLEKLHGDNYLHPDDMPDDPGLSLPLPGTAEENHGSPSRSFGASSSDTLNPLPAIAALGDRMFGAIPIAGPYLQKWRDAANAEIYGGTPEEARADIEKTVAANPGAAATGDVAGKILPYVAAASNPLTAGALGLEGSLGLRFLMGGLSGEALNYGDAVAHGESPWKALGSATRETAAALPFFALGGAGKKAETIKAAPSVADLKAQATPLYQQAENSGVVFSQPSVKAFVDGVTSKAMRKGLDPTLTPKAGAAIKRLQEIGGRNMSMPDAMMVREVLGNAATRSLEGSAKDHALATTILKEFDGFLEASTKQGPGGLRNMAVLQGDAAAAHAALKEGNALWSRAMKGQMLDKAIESAVARAATKDVRLDKALRDEFGGIEQSIIDGSMPGFTAKEIATIKEVAHGSGAQKIARGIGKLRSGGMGGVSGLAASGGWLGHLATGGNPVAAGVGATLGGATGVGLGALGALGRRAARGASEADANYASAVARGPALGNGAVSQPGRVLKALPGVGGRAVTTLTLDQYMQQKQALPAQ